MDLDRHRNQPVVNIKYSPCLWEGETAQILLIKKGCCEVMCVGENQLSDGNVVESLVYVNALEYIPHY